MTPKKAYDELVACLAGEAVPLREVISNGKGHSRVGKRVELGYNHIDELGAVLSDYDYIIGETNKMVEALEMFKSVCNCRTCSTTRSPVLTPAHFSPCHTQD